jgi:hypothetical protein
MAEAGILIIFVLLLLIAFDQWRREGHELVEVNRLRELGAAESQLVELQRALQLSRSNSSEEFATLIRSLQEVGATPQGQTALRDARATLEEIRRVKEQIAKDDSTKTLAQEVERQSHRIGNQEGQLRRYEERLKEAGLGKGERPCWVKPDGTIEYLYDVVLGSNGIRMREYRYDHREPHRALLPMPVIDPTELLSSAEFLRRTERLYNHSVRTNCRFFVVVYDATAPNEKELYKAQLRTVEGHFFKRLDRGTAPF